MKEHYNRAVQEYQSVGSATDLMKASFLELKINKENKWGWILSIFVALAIFLATDQTLDFTGKFKELGVFFAATQVAIIGAIITAYSILMIFLDESYIKSILELETGADSDRNTIGELKKQTNYFEYILFLNFLSLFFTVIFYILCLFADDFKSLAIAVLNIALREKVCLYNRILLFLNYIVKIFVAFYLSYSIRVIFEFKSLIYNMILISRATMIVKIQKLDEGEQKKYS